MKKITVYKILLIVLVIVAIILTSIVVKKYITEQQIENNAQEVIAKIKEQKTSNKQLDIIEEINEEIKGYKVIGIVNIPKIGIEYPILEKTNTDSLKLSITKFWGNKVNQIGNVVLAGHNYFSDKMFGKINQLQNGDIIELTDKQRVTIKYQIFKTYIVDPNDISCILAENENSREVTLITCTNGNKERFIVKAREFKEI